MLTSELADIARALQLPVLSDLSEQEQQQQAWRDHADDLAAMLCAVQPASDMSSVRVHTLVFTFSFRSVFLVILRHTHVRALVAVFWRNSHCCSHNVNRLFLASPLGSLCGNHVVR